MSQTTLTALTAEKRHAMDRTAPGARDRAVAAYRGYLRFLDEYVERYRVHEGADNAEVGQ